VDDVNAIFDRSGVTDTILVLDDFNFPRMLVNVSIDLESDLIQDSLSCDLEHINAIPIINMVGFFECRWEHCDVDLQIAPS
jgi:hypothetical protein